MSNFSQGVIALIPAYNEVEHIGTVVRAALKHLPVLVVDDGSSDATVEAARAAGANVLVQSPNQGKGAALIAGFRQIILDGFHAAITLDADGQHDPAEIPAFLETYRNNRADLIIGRRNFTLMPFIRRLSNTVGTQIFSWALGRPVPDNQSGYRLLSQRLMGSMLEMSKNERGFEFEVEMIVQCILNGYALDWVPIRTIYAGEKSHISPLKHGLKFLQVSWRTWLLMHS